MTVTQEELEAAVGQAFRRGFQAAQMVQALRDVGTPDFARPRSVTDARPKLYAVDTPTAEILELPLAPSVA